MIVKCNISRNLFLKITLFIMWNGLAQNQINGTNWTVNIPSITEAGNNYAGSYESNSNQVEINLQLPALLGVRAVKIHYTPNNWHNSLTIEARKTGNGNLGLICVGCSLNPSGTSAYKIITQVSTELFRGTGILNLVTISNIPIQLKINGISVTIPADNYSATIVFTIEAP
ncbi:hypothetical protein [Paenimyroides baculatum]|uniref:Uncharacterized protein n=1 Tax=Paenimyroides baculatum TaxID=2608000 RepID=A0A5M6C981_9FLAO|nr:hypothetical protein [Paenimyroides baculatum]KAA5531708.1 hypothetical protein F0460_15370 [Paenimyroides baculatum]